MFIHYGKRGGMALAYHFKNFSAESSLSGPSTLQPMQRPKPQTTVSKPAEEASKSSQRDLTPKELDEHFKNCPTYQEAKRRLTIMEAKKLLGDTRSRTDHYPLNATAEQVQRYKEARLLVRALLAKQAD